MSDKRRDNKGQDEREDLKPKKLSGAGESEDSSSSDPTIKVTDLLLSHITFGLLLLFSKEANKAPRAPRPPPQ